MDVNEVEALLKVMLYGDCWWKKVVEDVLVEEMRQLHGVVVE